MADAGAGGSARSSAATTRWTATAAGIACSCAYDLLVHGRGRASRRHRGGGGSRPPTSAARPTSSSSRCWSGEEARIRPGRLGVRVQLPSRPDARDHAGAGRSGVRGDRPWGRGAGRALRDDDRVRGGLALSGRVPARAPGDDAARGARRARRPPAARRRDREVPPRDVLLQRRRGGPCDGERRELVASPRDVPTYDHKPADERARGRRGVRRRPGARTRRGSGSSTSPTPTWSGTPA